MLSRFLAMAESFAFKASVPITMGSYWIITER